jgi:hypothetical protein
MNNGFIFSMRLISKTLSLFFMMIITVCSYAESQKTLAYQDYISMYSGLAIKKQTEFGIPASITLAQGILESGAGTSILAKKANNHFGIKCHDWQGASIDYNSDGENECFRKYDHVEESYNDHSLFLKGRPRYSELFRLNVRDYKGWAKGLLKCGYATDKAYADKLIKLIESYELYRFDSATNYNAAQPASPAPKTVLITRFIQRMYGIPYIYAESNDTYDKIAAGTNTNAENLESFNETPRGYRLQKGDVVFLDKKKIKADKPYYDHVVTRGESMYSISQKYGVQLKSLYSLNNRRENYVPTEGEVLKLR